MPWTSFCRPPFAPLPSLVRPRLVRGLAAAVWIVSAGAVAADAPWIQRVGEPVHVEKADDGISALAASRDGQRLFVGSGATVLILDANTFQPLSAPVTGLLPDSAVDVPLSRGTSLMAATWGTGPSSKKSGSREPQLAGELLLADWTSKKTHRVATLSNEPSFLAVSDDGTRAAVGYKDGSVQVFDVSSGKSLLGPLKVVKGEVIMGERTGDRVSALALSPDGARLAVAGQDTSVHLIDAATGAHPLLLSRGAFHGVSFVHGTVRQLAFTPDSRRIVSAEQGGNLALHDAATGNPLGALVQVRTSVAALTISADGKRVFIASQDEQLESWALQAP